MIKRQEAKVVYSIDAQKSETKKAEITVEFNAVNNRLTFLEKGKPLFYVSACDADSLSKKFKEVHKTCGDAGARVTINMPTFHGHIARSPTQGGMSDGS